MSELLPCPFCQTAEEFPPRIVRVRMSHPSYGPHGVAVHIFGGIEDDKCSYAVICDNCGSQGQIRKEAENAIKAWNTRHSKYPLAPVSSTLDRLLDSRFDLAAEAEADLGEIEHKGEKVMVKIKVVRGECKHKNKVSAAGKGTPIVSGWYCPDCKCLFSEDMEDKIQITDTILSKEPK